MPVVESLVTTADPLGAPVPDWVTYRGNDCRAFDRRSGREVYGPSHPFVATTDLLVTNGLIRFWVGGRLLPGYLNVQALAGSQWREVGCVQFGSAQLLGARLSRVTADAVTVALSLAGYGDAFVTIQRGERMLRCSVPSSAVAPTWKGAPPTDRLAAAVNGTGHFGNGLDGSTADLEFLLHQSPTAWATAFWLTADTAAASLTSGAGYLTIYDDLGGRVAECWLDTSHRINFQMGATTVQSAAQTFAIDDDLLIGLRFSVVDGMTLSVRNQAGAVAHVTDGSGVDPVANSYLAAMRYLQNSASWGDGNWGDGVWGGVTLLPAGVIDNHVIYDGTISDAEFAGLAAAAVPLDALPQPESRLVWYAPFDDAPIVTLDAVTSGRAVDPVTDANALTKAIAYSDAARTEVAALLATTGTGESAAEQHAQFAASFTQQVRVR